MTALLLGVGSPVGPTDASGQEEAASLIRESIARSWDVPASRIVLEDVDALPGAADSVHVVEAGNGRWLVTVWVGGGAVRRFQRAGIEMEVPVAARELRRGTIVGPEDVAFEPAVVWDGEPPPPDPLGLVAQRRIPPGGELGHPAVRSPYLVVGGQTIEAVLARSGVVMTVSGEALGSAREGDVLLVRLASGLRTHARAISPGRVELIDGAN